MLFLFFTLVLFSTQHLYSQNIDSLLTSVKSAKNDSLKFDAYNKIAFQYIFNNPEEAKKVLQEALSLAELNDNKYGIAQLANTKGIYMDVTGKSDSASYFFTKALNYSRKYGFKELESKSVNNLGMYNWNRGEYNEALEYFIESLKMSEETNDLKGSSIRLNNIGLIYQEINQPKKALDYHKKALEIRRQFSLKKDEVASLNNIGICYKDLGSIDLAISTFKEGVEQAKASDNLIDYYRILDNLANAYQLKQEYDLAIETYLKAINKPENFKVNLNGQISAYNNIAAAYNKRGIPKLALKYLEKGFVLLKDNPHLKNVSADLHLTASESYYMMDNYENARRLKDEFIAIKDSVFSEKNAKAIANLEVKYETEKKEKQILIQRAELAEQKILIQQRNYQLFGVIGFTLILGVIGYLLISQQKLKNKQLQKENELRDALLKIETQNKLQEQRLRISRDLHDNIGAQLTFIISSIDNLKYGFDIKDEKLNNKLNSISSFTTETIYELRDTIWAMNKSEISLEDLKTRITNYIDKAKISSKNLAFQFNVSEKIDQNKAFSSIEGMNIYRVIQEAIHNAIKHANANTIIVDIERLKSDIQITISDDGIGFDENTIEKGNGLNNMQKRIEDLNGSFKIVSKKNKGTHVILVV
ncbi:MAG: tetratricopeptide repeat protein [Flavobacteriaceae bacterium]|nr:tetratricopeptide repeat protein [Flavobacteriaceae bacterium]